EMADRVQSLRLPHHRFSRLTTILLVIKTSGPLQHDDESAEQQRCRRDAKDQIRREFVEPFAADLRRFDSGEHVERKPRNTAIADAAFDPVVTAGCRVKTAIGICRDVMLKS